MRSTRIIPCSHLSLWLLVMTSVSVSSQITSCRDTKTNNIIDQSSTLSTDDKKKIGWRVSLVIRGGEFWPGWGLCETPGDFGGWRTAGAPHRYWTQARVDCRLVGGNCQAPRTLKDTPEMKSILKQKKQTNQNWHLYKGRSLTGCRCTCSFFILSCGCWRHCWWRHCWWRFELCISAALVHTTECDPGIQDVKQGDFCETGNMI